MKTSKYYILFALLLALCFNVSCDDTEETLKTYNGETLLSFQSTSFNLSIPQEDLTLEIPVFSSSTSSSARTFNAVIVSATEGTEGEYTLGSITIPANEYVGLLSVDFDFSEIGGEDGDLKELVVSLETPNGPATYSDVATINYFREIVCNDVEVSVTTDRWGSENSWEITDSEGNVVASGGPYVNGPAGFTATYDTTVTLDDGCYTFTMFDSYGDGMGTGTYSVTCSILIHAQGGPSLNNNNMSESTEFCVNP